MRRLRVAVIGAGRLGGFHAQKLARIEGVELAAVADPDPTQRARVAAECGARPVADYRETLGEIDAAVVAAPTRLHHAIALDLLRRGIHALVEKPLCSTAAQAEVLVEAARRSGAVLAVGHVERFNPAWSAANAHLGEPKCVEAVRAGPFTFRSMDVGVVLDLMIHDLDLVLSLIRAPVRRIEALGISVLGGHEDVANARLVFESGCVAVLSASRVSSEAVRRMQVWSARGLASIDFATRATTFVRPSEALLRREFDAAALAVQPAAVREQQLREHLRREDIQAEAADALALEAADFIDSIRLGRQPRVTGEQGRDAVAVAEQILAKIAEHRWDDQPDGRVGPHATARPGVVPAPHFAWVHASAPRKEAG